MMKKISFLLSAIFLALSLSACMPNINNCNYHYCDVGRPSCVKSGVIIGRRNVIVGANSGVGTFTGTLGGAVIGSNLGGCGTGGVIGTLAGALVGGAIGNAIEQDTNRQCAYEYMIRLDNGDTISVVQGTDIRLRIHERVLVKFGRITRVVPACMY